MVILAVGCATDPMLRGEAARVAGKYAKERFGYKKPVVRSIGWSDNRYTVWVLEANDRIGSYVIIYVSQENAILGWEGGR